MGTLGDRLKQARAAAGFETAALAAERVGVPYHTYAQHENGTRGFRADKANLYARAFGVSPVWLLFGKGEAGVSEPGARFVPAFLPVRYRVRAGLWQELEFDEPPEPGHIAVLPDRRYADWPQWLEKVEGPSANLKIPDGHYIHVVDAIEMGYEPKSGDWVVVERRRDQVAVRERTVKQVEVNGGGVKLWPRSSDARYQEAVCMTDGARTNEDGIEVEVVGLVIGAYDPSF